MGFQVVEKLAYLLGVPEQIIAPRSRSWQEMASGVEMAPWIRACCRARQVALFHFSGTKKIFSLPDSFRSYCAPGIFDELQQKFRDAGDSWEFANRMTEFIATEAKPVMEAMDIPHTDALLERVFRWPVQNKATFLTLSRQYHDKKFSFPYDTFIPKPKSFGNNLRYLLTSDESLFSAPPIALAISACGSEAKGVGAAPVPETFAFHNVSYINIPFSPSAVSYREGLCVSYIDYDNMPPLITARICSVATANHPVKVFYDDRARGDVEAVTRFPHVEPCFVERMKGEKSLVDSRILTGVVRDCYILRPSQVVLYSSDSDFLALAPILEQEGVAFTVVAQEDSICPDYAQKLGEYDAACCVLSKYAVVPTPDPKLIAELLRHKLLRTPLADCGLATLTKDILNTFADEKYHDLLAKTAEAEIERLISGAVLSLKNGTVGIEFQESQKMD